MSWPPSSRGGRPSARDCQEWAPAAEKKTPQLLPLLKAQAGGDPKSTRRWVRLSLRQLRRAVHRVSPSTIARRLKGLGYALRANVKSEEPGFGHWGRAAQFEHIAQTQAQFLGAGWPAICVDTKK